ncbi:MAG: hypothetical protein JWR02_596 [Mucilaginibacter sp.]|nr:hypothetical protein [Mucilaginibacter sp.]
MHAVVLPGVSMLHYVSHDCMYGSHNVGAAHGRGGLVTFVATKVTKNAFSRKASLLHGPLPRKSGKTGAAIFLPG